MTFPPSFGAHGLLSTQPHPPVALIRYGVDGEEK